MSEIEIQGGLGNDPAEALTVAGSGGCRGNASTAVVLPEATDTTAAPCCGTEAEAQAAGGCCGTAAKAEAVASGKGCCG